MLITIKLTELEIKHLKSCSSHYDACEIITNIVEKIKKEALKC